MAIIHSGLRRILRPPLTIAFTALLAAMPTLVQHAGMAVAEMPLVLMIAATVVSLVTWMREGDGRYLVQMALFAAFAACTKNEGLALLPLVFITAILFTLCSGEPRPLAASQTNGVDGLRSRKRRISQLLLSAGLALLLILPWLIYRTALPRTHEDYGSKLLSVSVWMHNLHRLPQVFVVVLAHDGSCNSRGRCGRCCCYRCCRAGVGFAARWWWRCGDCCWPTWGCTWRHSW